MGDLLFHIIYAGDGRGKSKVEDLISMLANMRKTEMRYQREKKKDLLFWLASGVSFWYFRLSSRSLQKQN